MSYAVSSVPEGPEKTDDTIRGRVLYSELRRKDLEYCMNGRFSVGRY